MLGYTPTSAYFTLLNNSHDFTKCACTTNTFHVAEYLDEIAPTTTGELEDLLDALKQVSEDEACYALEQLDDAVYGSTGQIGVQSVTIYIQTLANRLRAGIAGSNDMLAATSNGSETILVSSTADAPIVIRGQCCRNEWNTWATGFGFGLGGNATTDGNAAGLDYSMGGTLAGWEAVDNCHRAGFYGGYVYNYIGTHANETNKVNGGTFGSYGLGMGRDWVMLGGGLNCDLTSQWST